MTFHISEPVVWSISAALGLFTIFINGLILRKELNARKSNENKFITKYLKIYSTSCIVCGALFGLFLCLQYFNGFCYCSEQIAVQLSTLQSVSIGLYQLERLHYTFAQSQVHSDKGYPKCIFFIMYTIGILLAVNSFIYPWLGLHKSFCGINKHYQYFVKYSKWYRSVFSSMFSIHSMVYVLWDFITLFLYIFKVISFKKYKSKNIEIYNRIMSILNRILILTITYEILAIGFIIFYVIIITVIGDVSIVAIYFNVMGCCIAVALNFSMFLMQQHNTDKYKNFLQIIYTLKFHYICCCCCCCKSMIKYEIEMYSNERKLEIDMNQNEKQTNDNDGKQDDDTMWETHNASTKIEKIKVDPFELSVETITAK